MKYVVEMASSGMMCISSFMLIGSGSQVIERYCLNSLRGCSVGITSALVGKKYLWELTSL
jgi:hypothetical protein